MQTGVIISLVIYMAGMLYIGYWAYKKTNDLSDYMLGGRGLGPAVTALSAGASDMSGWMMMGIPGAMFTDGISSLWITIGLTIGAYLNYILVAPRLRTYTEVADDSITIPDYLENRFNDTKKTLRIVSGLVIIIFFTLYCSAGLVSGGKLFESAFGMDYMTGMLLTGAVVVAYTLFGGFLAVSWTDFVQGCIMFIALVLVPIVAFTDIGDAQSVIDTVRGVDSSLLNMTKGLSALGLISLLAWGLGYFGQPHIIVRFMAITSVKDIKRARQIGMSWMIISLIGAALTGFIGVAWFDIAGRKLADPETVFIEFANLLFHPLITGFLLAAILAAIMSTISSQLLVTSSSVTEDFYKQFFKKDASQKQLVLIGRISVLAVAVIATLLSLSPNDTILSLVGYAWAGFGSAFGPLVLLSLFWKRMTKWGALAGIVVGAVTVLTWVQFPDLKEQVYEMIPGFFLSLIAIILVSLVTKDPSQKVQDQFENMEKTLEDVSK
ncbi:sodium/proline symporter PutP [Fictibacillus sp. NPDC058756]|uniref:sodium/proline symporter PutP n=1 Tax=Fictibacillus sp. NPDC058756 TaxID=3346625 RepID=UPI00368DE7F8